METPTTLPPDPDCEYCYGTGERYWHSETCDNDLCNLSGDYNSCRGQMEQCPCTMPPPTEAGLDELARLSQEMGYD